MREDRDVTVIETGSGSGFGWFLVGAALGVGLGVLFAPAEGGRTRRDLVRRSRRFRVRAGEALEDISDGIQTKGRKLKESVEDFADEVLDDVRDGKRKVERNTSHARDEMERRLAEARARARAAVGGDEPDEADDESE
ncbi:MAG TPA: YtxH domain-containing protein [Gemmatimonadales bacterium]|jgi:gas vesicle protein